MTSSYSELESSKGLVTFKYKSQVASRDQHKSTLDETYDHFTREVIQIFKHLDKVFSVNNNGLIYLGIFVY